MRRPSFSLLSERLKTPRAAGYHIATFQRKMGGANVRASIRVNQPQPSSTPLVRTVPGHAHHRAAGLPLVSGAVSPEWMGFAPSLTFIRQQKKFRISLFLLASTS